MAKKTNSRNSPQKKSIPWGAMFISFAVGAFAMFLMHLKDNVPADVHDKNVDEKTATKKSTKIEPDFSFYTLLPEMESIVPGNKLEVVTAPPAIKKADTAPIPVTSQQADPKKDSFLLQAGSFRNLEDAEGRRAQLAFLGIESRVQKVTIDNKDTWHRVQIGPVFGRDEADTLQTKLKKNNIDTLLMKAKHG